MMGRNNEKWSDRLRKFREMAEDPESGEGKRGWRFYLGVLVLMGGCVWAVVELILSIIYFF